MLEKCPTGDFRVQKSFIANGNGVYTNVLHVRSHLLYSQAGSLFCHKTDPRTTVGAKASYEHMDVYL